MCFKLLLAVTLVYFGNTQPSINTSISVWWLPTNTTGRVFNASSPVIPPSRFMLPVTRNVTPVVSHMLHLNARATVHWLSPPYPTILRAMLAKTPYEAHSTIRMNDVKVNAANDASCASCAGSTRARILRNIMSAAGEAAR
jgi:hypothetical protein